MDTSASMKEALPRASGYVDYSINLMSKFLADVKFNRDRIKHLVKKHKKEIDNEIKIAKMIKRGKTRIEAYETTHNQRTFVCLP